MPKRMRVKSLKRRRLRTCAYAALGVVLLLGGLFFSLRNVILRSVLDSRIRSYEATHAGDSLRVGTARFSGLAAIDLENIQVLAAAKDLAATVKKCSVEIDFLKMLRGRVRLKRLALSDVILDLSREDLPGPLPTGSSDAGVTVLPRTAPGPPPDFGARGARLLDLYFALIPDSLEIERLTLQSVFGDVRQGLFFPRLDIRGSAFETKLEVFDQGDKWAYLLAGEIAREEKRLELRLLPRERSGPAVLPFVERLWGLKVDFDSLAFGLHSLGRQDGVLRLDGLLAVSGLMLNHPSLAAEDIHFQNASIDYSLRVGADSIELDKATEISFNRLTFHPYFKFQAGPAAKVTLKLDKTEFKADDFFGSLPAGLFAELAGLETDGDLAYHLDFFIDFSRPEALRLASGLEKRGFAINRFGRVDFRAVNEPFLHTVFEDGRPVRSFRVGPENPDFRSLEEIPPFLKSAVMISEDGAFFRHRGFLLEPFKDSIAANLREKRFARGASTISMQLVKNLFLKRQKTIARKAEEMIITWLIEENRLVSKPRMLEIYMNIIEWGPQIYGAQEAARFYFDKDVADLTLAEAIFMASIIPQPKRFMASFDEEQRLRPGLQAYYADVSAKMLQKGWIDQRDVDALIPDVRLQGPARLLLKGHEVGPDEFGGLIR